MSIQKELTPEAVISKIGPQLVEICRQMRDDNMAYDIRCVSVCEFNGETEVDMVFVVDDTYKTDFTVRVGLDSDITVYYEDSRVLVFSC